MRDINQQISNELQSLNHQGLLRRRYLFVEKNKEAINFCSNDYLSLAEHPRIKKAYQNAFIINGTGSGGSMLLGGYHSAHQRLEKAFAEFLNVESALLFSSGYAANLAVMMLAKRLDLHCLIDKRVHASIYDGLNLSQVDYSRFRHNDSDHLCEKLKGYSEPVALITEGVFSMTGQLADLKAVREQLKENQFIWLDEAHSIGVVGEKGRGVADLYQLNIKPLPLRIIPLGKSFAAQGAIIAGQAEWIELLLQSARSYIYSTAMSPALAEGLFHTLEFIEQADDRRAKLHDLVCYFKEKRLGTPFHWQDSDSAIQYLKLSSNHQALKLHKSLEQQGIHCFAVRSPTVPAKESGIRFVLNYAHQPEDIDQLFLRLEKEHHEGSLL